MNKEELNWFITCRKKTDNTIQDALNIAKKYGQTDGNHHKMWVIDQIVRCLLKDDDLNSGRYERWIKNYEENENGEKEYEWDTGIIP